MSGIKRIFMAEFMYKIILHLFNGMLANKNF